MQGVQHVRELRIRFCSVIGDDWFLLCFNLPAGGALALACSISYLLIPFQVFLIC